MMKLCWLVLALVPFSLAFTSSQPRFAPHSSLSVGQDDCSESGSNNRRRLFSTTAMGIICATLAPVQAAQAATGASKEVLNNLLLQFRAVPMFVLVNGEGIPFMLIKQQERMAKGYAFASMEGAITVLSDAQQTAKEKGYFEIWESGTVITLPGDIAARLALQKRERIPTRGTGTPLDSLVDLIPTSENREAAILIDKRGFQDQGKMPLFYVEGLKAADDTLPLFLQKSALIKEWQHQRPGVGIPPIRAIDVTYMFEAALRGYLDKIPNEGNVSFVPDPEQVKIAQKLRSEGLTMYKFDKMVV